jgi:hypothetical protein
MVHAEGFGFRLSVMVLISVISQNGVSACLECT